MTRQWKIEKDESELRNHTLSIRFKQDEYRMVADTAWQNRRSASSLVREFVLEGLSKLKETI